MKTEQFKEISLANCSLWCTGYNFNLVYEKMDTVVATANGVTPKPAYDPHGYYHFPKRRLEFARQTKNTFK